MPRNGVETGSVAEVEASPLGFSTVTPLADIQASSRKGIAATPVERWDYNAKKFVAERLDIVLGTIDVLSGGRLDNLGWKEALALAEAFAEKSGHKPSKIEKVTNASPVLGGIRREAVRRFPSVGQAQTNAVTAAFRNAFLDMQAGREAAIKQPPRTEETEERPKAPVVNWDTSGYANNISQGATRSTSGHNSRLKRRFA